MSSNNRKKKVVVGAALGVFAFTGGIAIAYYNADIADSSNAGSASVAANQAQNIVATLGTAATGLVPGGPASTLSVTLTNGNDYAVGVDAKTLSLDLAKLTSSLPGCTNANALLSAAPVTGYSNVFAAKGTATVTFDVSMADSTTVDQTPCAGATFTIPVVVTDTV
jgi:hypothetical protein